MDPLEEARQDKLNAQAELNQAKEEFRQWKKVNGIKPKDEIYNELKQAELLAFQNFHKALDCYSKLISVTANEPARLSQFPPIQTANAGNLTNPEGPQEGTFSLEHSCAAILAYGPPRIFKSAPRESFVTLPLLPVLLVTFVLSHGSNIYQLMMGQVAVVLLLFFTTSGIFVLATSSLLLIAIYGWFKLVTDVISFVLIFTNLNMYYYYHSPAIQYVLAVLHPIFAALFLYCLQKYYCSKKPEVVNEGLAESDPLLPR